MPTDIPPFLHRAAGPKSFTSRWVGMFMVPKPVLLKETGHGDALDLNEVGLGPLEHLSPFSRPCHVLTAQQGETADRTLRASRQNVHGFHVSLLASNPYVPNAQTIPDLKHGRCWQQESMNQQKVSNHEQESTRQSYNLCSDRTRNLGEDEKSPGHSGHHIIFNYQFSQVSQKSLNNGCPTLFSCSAVAPSQDRYSWVTWGSVDSACGNWPLVTRKELMRRRCRALRNSRMRG